MSSALFFQLCELGYIPGNKHDSKRFIEVLNEIRMEKASADLAKTCGSPCRCCLRRQDTRLYLRRRGIKSNISCNKRNRKAQREAEPQGSNQSYKKRGCTKRFFSWLKAAFRKLAIRYERLNTCFMGLPNLACFFIYGEEYSSSFKGVIMKSSFLISTDSFVPKAS